MNFVKLIYNTLTIPCKKCNIASLISLNMKENIDVFLARSKLLIKLICCIAFGLVSNTCYLFKSMEIVL